MSRLIGDPRRVASELANSSAAGIAGRKVGRLDGKLVALLETFFSHPRP